MKKELLFLLSFLFCFQLIAQNRTIHVFVALCDNKYQGIVPVPATLGNGQNPNSNLYWGAAYGVRTFLDRSEDWEQLSIPLEQQKNVLDRALFRNVNTNDYLLAEAYDGRAIKSCTSDFLQASNGTHKEAVQINKQILKFGGESDLIAYVGHNGLMDFDLDWNFPNQNGHKPDAIILGCFTKDYFAPYLRNTKSKVVLWTTNFMAPEAYVLHAAITRYLKGECGDELLDAAAIAYDRYQKCGRNGARKLFSQSF